MAPNFCPFTKSHLGQQRVLELKRPLRYAQIDERDACRCLPSTLPQSPQSNSASSAFETAAVAAAKKSATQQQTRAETGGARVANAMQTQFRKMCSQTTASGQSMRTGTGWNSINSKPNALENTLTSTGEKNTRVPHAVNGKYLISRQARTWCKLVCACTHVDTYVGWNALLSPALCTFKCKVHLCTRNMGAAPHTHTQTQRTRHVQCTHSITFVRVRCGVVSIVVRGIML